MLIPTGIVGRPLATILHTIGVGHYTSLEAFWGLPNQMPDKGSGNRKLNLYTGAAEDLATIRVMSSCCSWGENWRTSATMFCSRDWLGWARWRRRDSMRRPSPYSSWAPLKDSVMPSV